MCGKCTSYIVLGEVSIISHYISVCVCILARVYVYKHSHVVMARMLGTAHQVKYLTNSIIASYRRQREPSLLVLCVVIIEFNMIVRDVGFVCCEMSVSICIYMCVCFCTPLCTAPGTCATYSVGI